MIIARGGALRLCVYIAYAPTDIDPISRGLYRMGPR